MAALSLAFDILARDNGASRTLNNVGDSAERAGKKGKAFGGAMKAGVGIAVGAIATLGLGAAFKTFITEANEAAKVGRLTNAAVASTGGVAKVTSQQVADLAEALSVKAGIDDELIQSGANVLLTFTNIRNEAGKGNKVFDQAAEAALNMSTALGTDLQGSITMVGKALNDPIKGTTALGKAGIQFTKDQKEQIKVLTESGDLLGAQKIILGELETQFGGAAEAAASPLDKLKVSAGNLGEAIGGLLLPGAGNLAEFLTAKVIPVVQGFIEDFGAGVGAAGRFRDTLTNVKDVAKGLFDILVKGNFTGGLSSLGIEEDSKIVEYLFTFRDALIEVGGFLRDLYEDGKAAADVLITGLKPVWDELTAVWNESLKPALQELMTVLQDELGPIFGDAAKQQGPLLKQLAEMTVSVIKFLVPSIKVGIITLAALVRAFSDSIEPIAAGIRVVVAFGRGMLVTGTQVYLTTQNMIAAVRNFTAGLVASFQQARAGAAASIGGVVGTIRALPGNIAGAVGNLGGTLRQAGRDLIQGLISGITDRLSGALGIVRNMANAIASTARSALRISSPSRVFKEIGGQVTAGLALGLNDLSAVDASMRNVVGRLDPSMPGGPSFPASSGAVSSRTDDVVSALQSMSWKVQMDPNGLTRIVMERAGSLAEQGSYA